MRRASVGVALAALIGSVAVGFASSTSVDAAPAASTSPALPLAPPVFESATLKPSRSSPLSVAPRPLRVRIPALRIDAALDPLQLDADDVLVPPPYGRAGWYEAGPEPGERGRAVIAGHVDSATGLDVFSALGRARAGDRIVIGAAGGSTLTFVVDSVGVYPRSAFPTDRVYGGPKRRAEIRLITCGGRYDRTQGGYQSNVIVFGHLTRRSR
ncbi:class F sortase [Sporichthya sp.]|uniref:class F sortase n=1 Tax=Sporichthya sp. TaxID=65475 RepID=UPI0017CB8CF1|nr:class F sortase [Sporichthya sp.]MBA3744585.1 class F sortase [Sporichthya sp.]